MTARFEGVCTCRKGSGRLCPMCLHAKQLRVGARTPPPLHLDPAELRAELALLGLSAAEIRQLIR